MAGAWAPRAGGWELGVWPAAPPAPSCCSTPVAGRSHVMQRVLSTAQFLWVLGQALVDGLTRWLHTFTRHHSAMSNVLRAERYLLTQELLRVSGGGSAPVPPRPPPCRPAPPRPLVPSHHTHLGRPEPVVALQGGEVRLDVLDQLYASEAEAAPPGTLDARDAPSTASR